jgi:5-methylcytosine-specific restriction endonuclease McrA
MAAKYRNKPCIVCGTTQSTCADHIKTFGSGGECSHENLWPLCHTHHVDKGNMGLQNFVKKYPIAADHLLCRGWETCTFTGKWMRLTKEGWDEGEDT